MGQNERGRTSGAERTGQNERGKATGGTHRAPTSRRRQPRGGLNLSTAFSSRYCVEIRCQVHDNNNERTIVAKVGQGARDLRLTFLTTNSSDEFLRTPRLSLSPGYCTHYLFYTINDRSKNSTYDIKTRSATTK